MELYPEINDCFEEKSFGFTPGDNIIKTNFASGPFQSRRRSTKRIDSMAGILRLSKDELETFETWYNSTLKDGSLSFAFPHPVTGVSLECKFSEVYSYKVIGFQTYEISLKLLIV